MKIELSPQLKARRKFSQGFVFTIALASLLACGIGIVSNNSAAAVPTLEPNQLSQNPQNLPNRLPKDISKAVLQDASKRSGVAISKLKITQVTAKTFSNPCVFKFGEICTREYNPISGWEVKVNVNEGYWTYHVNKSGSQIILDPKVTVSSAILPKAIANDILSDASKRSGVSIAALKIHQSTEKTFSNPCVFNFGEICTQEYNPVAGWSVIVKVKGRTWTYHVNKSTSQIVLDPKVLITNGK